MSDFEEYIKNKYPEDYAVLSTMYSNQAMEELYPDQFEVWQHQQAIIDSLKAQLNNMEACYIEKKKERDELQNRLKAVYALSRMRAAVIGSWKREELSIKVRKAISHLVKKEQALRGAND